MESLRAEEPQLRSDIHPTKDELINTVVNLLDHVALDVITSEQVLEISGISRGSLYHHFQDFAELLELAQVRRYAMYVDRSIDMLTERYASVNSREELVSRAKALAVLVHKGPEFASSRLERVTAISKVTHNPRMAAALGVEQERLTSAMADIYHDLQLRKLANPALEPRTFAVLFQTYNLGRIVDDFTVNHMSQENWLVAVSLIIENVMYPKL